VALQDGFSLAHALVGPGGGLLVGDELRSALRTWRETRRQRGLLAQEASEYVARACKAHEAPSEGQKSFLRSLVAKVTARTLSVDKKALNLWLSKLYAD
jgi:2-polyprenyl-6-methoxyphenol hydroxylase-like FAD-dependent oxidoreductase